MSGPVRLQRYLAAGGVAARRKAEELITAGRVRVNGVIVTVLGTKVDPAHDDVTVDGEAVVAQDNFYVLFNKPKGCITAVTDDRGRPTVMEYLPNLPVPVKPVGRLDFYTEGVLLLTNDGELAARLLAPASHVPKTYHVKVHGQLSREHLTALRRGIQLDDGTTTLPAEVAELPGESKYTWLALTIHEGKHRQIHRMIEALGYRVDKLQRVAFANLTFHALRIGDARELTQLELNALRDTVGLDHSAVARGTWHSRREDTDIPRRAKTKARDEAEAASLERSAGEPPDVGDDENEADGWSDRGSGGSRSGAGDSVSDRGSGGGSHSGSGSRSGSGGGSDNRSGSGFRGDADRGARGDRGPERSRGNAGGRFGGADGGRPKRFGDAGRGGAKPGKRTYNDRFGGSRGEVARPERGGGSRDRSRDAGESRGPGSRGGARTFGDSGGHGGPRGPRTSSGFGGSRDGGARNFGDSARPGGSRGPRKSSGPGGSRDGGLRGFGDSARPGGSRGPRKSSGPGGSRDGGPRGFSDSGGPGGSRGGSRSFGDSRGPSGSRGGPRTSGGFGGSRDGARDSGDSRGPSGFARRAAQVGQVRWLA